MANYYYSYSQYCKPSLDVITAHILADTLNVDTYMEVNKYRLATSIAVDSSDLSLIGYATFRRAEQRSEFLNRLAQLDKNMQSFTRYTHSLVLARRFGKVWLGRALRPSNPATGDPGGTTFQRLQKTFQSLSV